MVVRSRYGYFEEGQRTEVNSFIVLLLKHIEKRTDIKVRLYIGQNSYIKESQEQKMISTDEKQPFALCPQVPSHLSGHGVGDRVPQPPGGGSPGVGKDVPATGSSKDNSHRYSAS